jgi:hypothetical protein
MKQITKCIHSIIHLTNLFPPAASITAVSIHQIDLRHKFNQKQHPITIKPLPVEVLILIESSLIAAISPAAAVSLGVAVN